MKKKKCTTFRLLSVFLSAALVISGTLPSAAMAAEPEAAEEISVEEEKMEEQSVEEENVEEQNVEEESLPEEASEENPAEAEEIPCEDQEAEEEQTGEAAPVEINETTFPDETFREYVKTTIDTDKNGTLSEAEIFGVTEIGVSAGSIKSLKGIELFTNLESLVCGYNKLNSLDVSQNKNLSDLSCYNNQLSSLDISQNKNLSNLSCSDNQLSSLDVSQNGNLSYLDCYNNRKKIELSEKRTFDLSTLPGKFDVSKASNWDGGKPEGTILTVDPDTEEVTYTYDLGRDKTEKFTLVISDEPEPVPTESPIPTTPPEPTITATPTPTATPTATPKPVTVGQVKNLKLTSTANSAKLTWKKASGAAGYKVERYNPSKKKYVVVATVKGTSYTNKKLSAATAYQYRVRGYVTKNKKTTYGKYSSVRKILTAPSAPVSVKIKRSGAKTNKAKAILTFKQSTRAAYYDICQYNKKTKKYAPAFRVKGKILYKYNAKTKKYAKVNSAKIKNKVVTCTLTNLKLKSDKTQKYIVKAVAEKKGYPTKASSASKVVILK